MEAHTGCSYHNTCDNLYCDNSGFLRGIYFHPCKYDPIEVELTVHSSINDFQYLIDGFTQSETVEKGNVSYTVCMERNASHLGVEVS